MLFNLKDQLPHFNWERYLPFQQHKEVPAKTILLEEGKVSQQYIFIERGCVRLFFNNNGEDKTWQFFFENEGLMSFDSFVNNTPSQFTIETVEPSVLLMIPKKHVMALMDDLSHEPGFLQVMLRLTTKRQTHYVNEFISSIRDTPEHRYQRLLDEKPQIIQRIPQHYIASYLGVSSVHLSRIKSKLAKGKSHF